MRLLYTVALMIVGTGLAWINQTLDAWMPFLILSIVLLMVHIMMIAEDRRR